MIVENVEVCRLECDDLIVRTGMLTLKQLATLTDALAKAIDGSFSIFWFCCDANPTGPHSEHCEMHNERMVTA